MKKLLSTILLGGLFMANAAAKTLVVYYSYSDTGNTRRIAQEIQKKTGADIAEIEPVVPYSDNYDEVVDKAKRDVARNFKPEIKPLKVSLSDYDTIIIGTPTWWYKMASPVLTFMSSSDFSGKKVALFCTHAGWPGTVIKDMSALCTGADVFATQEIQFGTRAKAGSLVTKQPEIDDFIAKIQKNQRR
ncbi:flavodoxin [Treponema sp.]|uniref:flavodoxin n=1 Tax=Treponema sp. TaxID=166 RepID=UPI003EFFA5D1